MKELVKYGFVLGIICLVASGILATVNAITEPRIELQKNKEERAALERVLPLVQDFKLVEIKEGLSYYKGFSSGGKLTGFVIKVFADGYSSEIITLVSLDLNLKIMDIQILSQSETPGLGTRITEPDFLSQFKGKALDRFSEIHAITGATISSSALINGVRQRIVELEPYMLKEVKSGR